MSSSAAQVCINFKRTFRGEKHVKNLFELIQLQNHSMQGYAKNLHHPAWKNNFKITWDIQSTIT
jgi:hypothetical protein